MKDGPCAWHRCRIESTTVTVSDRHGGKKPRFCGRVHAALWLLCEEGHTDLAAELADDFASGRERPTLQDELRSRP
jgi:hypothetical protein